MTTELIFHITTLILIFAYKDLNEIEYQNRSHSFQTIFDRVLIHYFLYNTSKQGSYLNLLAFWRVPYI